MIPNGVAAQCADTEHWRALVSKRTGYFRGFDRDLLSRNTKNLDVQVQVIPYLNKHIWQGDLIIKVNKKLSDKAIDNLLFCFDISSDRHEDDKGIGGMIKLMEIAVKAMSPGINDPGTAIAAVIKLGSLISVFLRFPQMVSQTLNGKFILIENNASADELMRVLVQPIRHYSKQDSAVMYELITSLQHIEAAPLLSQKNREAVTAELQAARFDLDQCLKNPTDRTRIFKLFEK